MQSCPVFAQALLAVRGTHHRLFTAQKTTTTNERRWSRVPARRTAQACDFYRVKNGCRVARENVRDVSVAVQRGFRRPSSGTRTRFARPRARCCSSVRHLASSWSDLLAQPRQKLFSVAGAENHYIITWTGMSNITVLYAYPLSVFGPL